MNILVVGAGGREHSIIMSLKKNSRIRKIYCLPGNGGISQVAECFNIQQNEISTIVKFAKNKKIDYAIITSEEPLVLGLVDALQSVGVTAFGPTKNAALIEGSKVFAKKMMEKYHIPTARYRFFTSSIEAIEYVYTENTFPIVIKANGLASGKGTFIANDLATAHSIIVNMIDNKVFGEAGEAILVEEFLSGSEVSIMAFFDGHTLLPMETSRDYKRINSYANALNTGGMGAISPCSDFSAELCELCNKTILEPTVLALSNENITFKGVLYLGIMITHKGPRVLEYNVRFGDPEIQVLLARLETDLLEVLLAATNERLNCISLKWKQKSAACVVLASQGYPEKYILGYDINGLSDAQSLDNVTICHAGTQKKGDRYLTSGGRVLNMIGVGDCIEDALNTAYLAASKVSYKNMIFRDDIGK